MMLCVCFFSCFDVIGTFFVACKLSIHDLGVEDSELLNVEGVGKYCGCRVQLSRVWRTSPEICV